MSTPYSPSQEPEAAQPPPGHTPDPHPGRAPDATPAPDADAGSGRAPAPDSAPGLGAGSDPGPTPGPGSAPVSAGSAVGRLVATVERLRREVREADAAADGRALVELAKGVLVARLGCGPAHAAEQLDRLAEQAGVSRLELAADVVNQASRDRVSEIAADFAEHARTPPSPEGEVLPLAVRLRTAESGVLAADDTEAVARSLLDNALLPLGAVAVAVWTAGTDGSLVLAGHAGFPAAEAARWRYVPPEVATFARLALTERGPVTSRHPADLAIPSLGRHTWPDGGRIALPSGSGGRVHGVLEICWPTPLAPQPPQILRQLEALAELCSHTLHDLPAPERTARSGPETRPDLEELTDLADNLHDPALVLTPALDDQGNLTDFRIQHVNERFADPVGRPRGAISGSLLLEAYPTAAEDNGLFGKIERVHATGEPLRTQRTTLTALVGQVALPAVADVSISRHGSALLLLWRTEDETARLASLLQHAQRLGRVGGFEENLTSGKITWNSQLFHIYGRPATARPVPMEELPDHAHPDDAVDIRRFLRTVLHHRRDASVDFRLQRPDGITRHLRVVAEPVLDAQASLVAVRGAYQDISAQHWTEVALAATRDQLAYTEAESADRIRLTLQLQQAIMPPAPPPLEVPGMRIAVRYRPAESEALVGGDWYDTVVLPSGDVMFCVGDVAGHGIGAATGMVVLRNALRGLAVTGAGPGQLLSWLNKVAHRLTDQVTATAVCGLYDPRTRTLRWARAGHLPPVLIRGESVASLPLSDGLLLGVLDEVLYAEQEIRLESGDTLLMFTDGLVERRDLSVNEAVSEFLIRTRDAPRDLERRLDRLLTHSKSDTDDDTCLIGIQLV
ncbi:SpoIIE family protein phosphatase [Streptomyces sp. NPDC058655]|uniref:SpoIIE family protein phosphatase n=1 Tax=Streptomyces sp. NPDC058655 TaxID=3346577 RepID=UPI003660B032